MVIGRWCIDGSTEGQFSEGAEWAKVLLDKAQEMKRGWMMQALVYHDKEFLPLS